MAPLAGVRARWRAFSVCLVSARAESARASLADRDLDAWVAREARELDALLEATRALPAQSPLRRAAELALEAGRRRLRAEPESEAYALAAHEHELALRALRAAIVRARS